MCPDRVAQGKPTACAELVRPELPFGDRDELIAEARQRIRDNPANYVDHIYGLEEVGGTSVLLLSSVRLRVSVSAPTWPRIRCRC